MTTKKQTKSLLLYLSCDYYENMLYEVTIYISETCVHKCSLSV